MCTLGSQTFTSHPHTNRTCIFSPGRSRHHLLAATCAYPTKGWPSWVDLGDWSLIERNVLHRELNPNTCHPSSSNWAQCRVTSSMCTTPLQLSQGNVKGKHGFVYCLVMNTPIRHSGIAQFLKGSHSFTCLFLYQATRCIRYGKI